MDAVIIIGAGIGGLTLALTLHRAGIASRIYEAAPEIRPIGVGINVLPHATKELSELGLEPALAKVAVETKEATFFNRFGQLIYAEPLGRYAGYGHPQFSIHRGDLQMVLLEAARERIGADRILTGWKCVAVEQGAEGVTVHFRDASDAPLPSQRGSCAIACDGIHSALRKQFFPDEGPPRYSGVNMWRGTTRWKPFLSGANMVRAGWLATGKMVIYPIRNAIDAEGRQLVNWVAEIETPNHRQRDWNRPGELDDVLPPLRRLAFRLARRARLLERRRHGARIPDGRPGPAAALEPRPRDAPRRRRPPHGAARLERGRTGDPRRPRPCRLLGLDCRSGRGAQGL
jgi:2-polyprenyl-6-methoxyphenol hydroxylase-like FAD-dependent oxidoreductase